jgi:hypothetical protein
MNKFNFINNLLAISDSKNINKCIDEWIIIGERQINDDSIEKRCICNKEIKYYYYCLNIKNKKMIKVGTTCYRKFIDYYKENTDNKKNNILQKDKKNKKLINNFINGNYYNIDDLNEYCINIIFNYYDDLLSNNYKNNIYETLNIINLYQNSNNYNKFLDLIKNKINKNLKYETIDSLSNYIKKCNNINFISFLTELIKIKINEEEQKKKQFEEEMKKKQLEEEIKKKQFEEELKKKQLEEELKKKQFEEELKKKQLINNFIKENYKNIDDLNENYINILLNYYNNLLSNNYKNNIYNTLLIINLNKNSINFNKFFQLIKNKINENLKYETIESLSNYIKNCKNINFNYFLTELIKIKINEKQLEEKELEEKIKRKQIWKNIEQELKNKELEEKIKLQEENLKKNIIEKKI